MATISRSFLPKFAALVLVISVLSLLGCQTASERPAALAPPPASSLPASEFIYPSSAADGATTVDPFIPFSWKPVSGATAYYLQVGTAAGLQDVYAVGDLPPNVTSWSVSDLLPGVYTARLNTRSAAGWGYRDIQFTALPTQLRFDQTAFYAMVEQQTANVRLSTVGLSNTVVPGTPLAAEVASRLHSIADCSDYAYTLSQMLQRQSIYSRIVTITLNGPEVHTTLEYYDPFWQEWSLADATFGVVYFDDSAQRGQGAAELNQYVVSESWNSIKPKFVTLNGELYMTNYYMDPITLYLNLVPQGEAEQLSVIHDPMQFLIPFATSSTNPHGYYLFGFGNSAESLQLDNPPGPYTANSGILTIAPSDSTLWSDAYTLNDDWSITSTPADAQAYTFRRVLF